ncbi:hypothetical protein [Parvularcula sp. IMCC14364]|uniref:hypothetical protein n=1 Tax=Parvularcula sp. IMCC14364 TaxID=3067902 RepID=UPI00274281A5|nr:hypothetical protein [Parvularcula sp. IMCC14364]
MKGAKIPHLSVNPKTGNRRGSWQSVAKTETTKAAPGRKMSLGVFGKISAVAAVGDATPNATVENIANCTLATKDCR